MIERFRQARRRLRRLLDRFEWAARLLGVPPTDRSGERPGLLVVQVDGLSHDVLADAMARGDAPFLAHLHGDEGYRLHHVYAGVPSTTPAAQAELFYGVTGAVPAFSYRDHEDGHVVRMWQRDDVTNVENRFVAHRSLLEGGASYANVYAGRAHHARFCMASLDWSDPFRTRHPWALPALLALAVPDLLRLVPLVGRELVVGLADYLGPAGRGHHRVSEAKFALSRVLVAVVLRELCAIGATIDVARGLPVVHVNLIGYDEYAHRRGPTSETARRALRDADRVIGRLTAAAWRSSRRDYDVWVLSDHGQETTEPYERRHGRSVQAAVHDVLRDLLPEDGTWGHGGTDRTADPDAGVQGQRTRLLGDRVLRLLVPAVDRADRALADRASVTAQGPLGHVYLPASPTSAVLAELARALVERAGVPLVATADGPGAAVWTRGGRHRLPEDAREVLGEDHPYSASVAADLVAVCHHPDAGELVISGWDRRGRSLSFPHENGSHGGPGPQETDAFALLPSDTELCPPEAGDLRAGDLRRSALGLLDRPIRPSHRLRDLASDADRPSGVVRIMTYNVHSCIGLDGRLSAERVARVIARHAPDVVALQELDVGRARTGHVDQAARLAELLEMLLAFHPALSVEEEQYGDAVLSRLPMRLVRADQLPQLPHRPPLEPRGALWVELATDAGPLHVVNTHLSLHPQERWRQAGALAGPGWIGAIPPGTPTVLCGDFNALPWFPECRRLRRHLDDAQAVAEGHRPRGTFGGRFSPGRIDHVFVDPTIGVTNVEIPRHALARVASDHLPLLADLRLPAPGGARASTVRRTG